MRDVEERTRKKTPVEELLDDVESYIEDWFQAKLPFAFHGRVRWTPPTDVYETADEFHVTMAIPGIEPEDVKVEFERAMLSVRGIRREAACDNARYHKMEIPIGPFERRVRINRPVRADDIGVSYRCGLLRIVLPKSQTEPRDVPID